MRGLSNLELTQVYGAGGCAPQPSCRGGKGSTKKHSTKKHSTKKRSTKARGSKCR